MHHKYAGKGIYTPRSLQVIKQACSMHRFFFLCVDLKSTLIVGVDC
jgi:hypothetical protein